jgi:predicted branched-subunit amino acid permease
MPPDTPADEPPEKSTEYLRWYLRGALRIVSVPAFILASSFVGFAALAMQAGITLPQAVFMTGIVWALPAKVVMIGAIIAGNGLPAAAFAVALSSVRLTPMVVALVPELRTQGTRKWVLYLLSHFVAVTSWVIAMEDIRNVPPTMRTAWYGGVGSSLVILNMIVVTAVYALAGGLPPAASAALFLLTPIYFLTSLWGSARERAGHVAMVLGLALGPTFALLIPDFSLLATGLAGGSLAYLHHRLTKRRAAS